MIIKDNPLPVMIASDMQGMMWGKPDLAGVAVRLPGDVAAFSTV